MGGFFMVWFVIYHSYQNTFLYSNLQFYNLI